MRIADRLETIRAVLSCLVPDFSSRPSEGKTVLIDSMVMVLVVLLRGMRWRSLPDERFGAPATARDYNLLGHVRLTTTC